MRPNRPALALPALLLALSANGLAAAPPRDLDLAFVLDTTGSMSGELREAKERVRQVAEALSSARPGARVRLGVVAYRDRGDDYVTRVSPLSEDVAVTDAFLSALRAGGGGDGPEDVLAGVHAALTRLDWDDGPRTDREVFLVGDAPPHLDYDDGPRPEQLVEEALRRRVVLNAIGCRSLSRGGVSFFRELAYATEGAYHHVGRVELGGETEHPGVADAVVGTLGGEAEPATAREGVVVTVSDAPAPEARDALLVERLVVDGERRCLLAVSVPLGLGLEAAPEVERSAEALDVHLVLRSGQGESRTYELAPCPPASLPIRLSLED
jgi:hypothetical protein